jgi:hypothetical protein
MMEFRLDDVGHGTGGFLFTVMPAKAGIQYSRRLKQTPWRLRLLDRSPELVIGPGHFGPDPLADDDITT